MALGSGSGSGKKSLGFRRFRVLGFRVYGLVKGTFMVFVRLSPGSMRFSRLCRFCAGIRWPRQGRNLGVRNLMKQKYHASG